MVIVWIHVQYSAYFLWNVGFGLPDRVKRRFLHIQNLHAVFIYENENVYLLNCTDGKTLKVMSYFIAQISQIK